MRDYTNFAAFSPTITNYGFGPNEPEETFQLGFNANEMSTLTRNLSQGVGGKNDGETVLAARKIPCCENEQKLTDKIANGLRELDQPGLQVMSRLLKKIASVADGLRWGEKSVFDGVTKTNGAELSVFGNVATNSRIMDARILDDSLYKLTAVFDFVLEDDSSKGGTVQVEFVKKDAAVSKDISELSNSDFKEVNFIMKKSENLLDPKQVLQKKIRFDVSDPNSQLAKGMGKWLGFLQIHHEEVNDKRLLDLHADMQVF